jgi:hypothetical protein
MYAIDFFSSVGPIDRVRLGAFKITESALEEGYPKLCNAQQKKSNNGTLQLVGVTVYKLLSVRLCKISFCGDDHIHVRYRDSCFHVSD